MKTLHLSSAAGFYFNGNNIVINLDDVINFSIAAAGFSLPVIQFRLLIGRGCLNKLKASAYLCHISTVQGIEIVRE